ncbi:hypothetical protein [Aquabacterium sp.]|uniref:retrotransposon gag family protein n=1 Tax=Aquabacterium sp. TaxID=1872578 RepID=UPI00260D97F5|nr:hypothetical protein [Aquabacterium sp.]MDD2978256.1 hypothetical protein [Aquabacterium sp.]
MSASSAPVPQHVLALRRNPKGPGQQFQVKWANRPEPTWTAASTLRAKHAALVSAFEQRAASGQQQPSAANGYSLGKQARAAGAEQRAEGTPAPTPANAQQGLAATVVVQASAPGGAPTLPSDSAQADTDDASPQGQLAAAMQLVQEQARELQSLRAAQQQAGATLVAAAQSRFSRSALRPSDLPEYDGAAGNKLDEWLQALAKTARLYGLNDVETIQIATFRLNGAALQWWEALGAAEQAATANLAGLAAALRARFQPVTTSRLMREQLSRLQQGGRHVNDYIAEFQRLRAALPDMSEADTLFAFERGLRRDLAEKLQVQGVSTLVDAIALAARVGGLAAASSAASHAAHSSRAASAHQMEIDDGDGAPSLEERVTRSVLNALRTQQGEPTGPFMGLGAKTQTHRGYAGGRGAGSQSGSRGGRGGRFGGTPRFLPAVPGVPEHIVRQRWDARQCVRCGTEGHTSHGCPNAISASGN